MKIQKDVTNIDEIVETLSSGGLVILPTETVYGAMVDATNEEAVAKLNSYKNRPLGKPFSIAVTDMQMAEEYVSLNETAKNLYKNFLPGPLTIVSKGKGNVAKGVESEEETLGVRIPDYPLVLSIVEKLGKPITATSANASYQKRPYKIEDILENISEKQKNLIDLIVDVGELPKNEPSTVIDTTVDDGAILRQGDIKLKDTNEVFSKSEENTQNSGKELWQKYESYYGKRAIVFALTGEMGAGKTQMTKGIARAMGVKDDIISPTYDLELEYEKGLIHIDTWRMENEKELEQLGLKKQIDEKKVLVIEWADKVTNAIKQYEEEAVIIWVKIAYGKKENERIISWGVL